MFMVENAKILIVDDVFVNRDILQDIILTLGHTPLLAEDGVSALEKIRKELPDIVLLDIRMPEMDGYEVLRQIKDEFSLQRHIPIIMITAIDEIESMVQCIEMGAEDYLVKPFNRSLLKARIDACLNRKSFHDLEEKYRRQTEKINLNLEERLREKEQALAEANEKLRLISIVLNQK